VKKISTRFALLMAAAAVVPLLAYGAVSIISLRGGAREAVIQGNLNVARRAAEQIELYVSSSIRILQAVAAELQRTGLLAWQQERILKNYALKFPEFTELTLTDENGDTVVTSRLGPSTVTVPGADSLEKNGVLMSRFALDDDLLPTTTLAIPVEDAEQRRWLVARVSLEELWRMVDRIRVGQRGYALVVTRDGQLIAHGEPESKSLVARREEIAAHPLIAPTGVDAASGNTMPSPDSREYSDWASDRIGGKRHGTILGVRAQVPFFDWTVVVEQPTSEAYAIPQRLQQQLVVAITLALFVMLSIGYFWGRSFIDPILRLTRGTRALAEGHLEERVAVDSQDELGQLGTAFNNMADKLVELQEDVRKKERQAMFGRVSIGLVHDLSTPIQNIGNACKMITMLFDDLEYRETFKRTVDRELVLIKRMLEDLRNVAKPVPLEKFPLDLNKILAEVAESMLGSAQSSGLTLETALCLGPLYIEGDRYALNRVYGNLLKNAFQATAPQGKVAVRTMRQDDQAVVEVSDTGSGIPPERLATIFDDFVTTKKRGLGLGLAISKKIVEQLGGTITVASEVGRGTTFTMRFQLTQARPEQLAVS
jgi:two-component system, NtrC family, sensor kinase